MNRTIKTITSVAAAAMLSVTMLQTAHAASWNYSSLFSAKKNTTTNKTTTTAKSTTNKTTATAATKSSGTQSTTSSSGSSESQMISMINEDRGKAGLKALKSDSGLRAGALKHSQDMASNNFFSHTSPTYGTFSQRASASGAKASAENIALNGSVAKAEASFMTSDGHRANIMNSNYTRVGVGIVYSSSKGAYYITQWFGR